MRTCVRSARSSTARPCGRSLDRPVKRRKHARMAMTRVASGVELFYERFGDPDRPTVLLVCGLGSQCTNFDVELCELIVERGFGVVRFDNRDCGLSTHFDDVDVDVLATLAAATSGEVVSGPYTLSDMAVDAIAVLDAVGVE